MDLQEQVTRHASEIGELRGKLDALATKDFVREQNAQLLKDITAIIEKETSDIRQEINKNREFRTRVTAFGAVIAVVLSIIVAALNALVGLVSIGLLQLQTPHSTDERPRRPRSQARETLGLLSSPLP